MFNIFFCASFAFSMQEVNEGIDITWETSGDQILILLMEKFGRYDLEEYWKNNNFAVDDPSIDSLFVLSSDSPESSDLILLENARKHPKLRIAPQRELRQKGQDKALGLFAGETILKGQPIIEYVGQTKVLFTLFGDESNLLGWLPAHLSRDEASQSHYNFGFQGLNVSRALWEKGKLFVPSSDDLALVDVCIDPAKRGNVARFANHSIKWANAELIVVAENIDGKVYLHPLLAALRDIEPHEEILWNYGKPNGYIDLKGKELNPEYARIMLVQFTFDMNFQKKDHDFDRYKELQAAPYFHTNLTCEEAKKLLVEPASYLLRQENSRLFFCVNGQDYRLDENFELTNRTEFREMEFWIIDGRFTFEPKSDPNRYGNHFNRLYELRKGAKLIICRDDNYLMISSKKAVRR
jgi:hypothetical protein